MSCSGTRLPCIEEEEEEEEKEEEEKEKEEEEEKETEVRYIYCLATYLQYLLNFLVITIFQ